MKKNKRRAESGITLIALVITIIVLLILAGISISMLTGDNSILNQATSAKEKTSVAQIEESINLAVIGALANSKGTTITESNLVSELNSYFGEDGYTISGDESSGWTVTVDDVTKIISNSGNITEPVTLVSLKESGKAVSSDTTITDDNGDSITIPAGFNVASDSATEVIGGVVIEDSDDNQYVWIPVFEKSSERDWGVDYSGAGVTSALDYDEIESALKTYTATYASSSCKDVWYGNSSYGRYGYYNGSEFIYYTNGNMTEEEYTNLYHSMLSSIYTNGGFYIGRYEMGIDVVESTTEAQKITRVSLPEYTVSTATITSTTTVTDGAPSIDGMATPVSKANAVAYSRITQSQAQMLAESLNYSSVTSSLMFGVQWDAVCVFIEKYDSKNTATTASQWLTSNTYSKLWGNYTNASFTMNRGFYSTTYSSTSEVTWNEKSSSAKGTGTAWLCTTGASDQNSRLNIYDFAGNLYEWTLERSSGSSNSPCVDRGGYFNGSNSASYRSNNLVCASGYSISARASLWM